MLRKFRVRLCNRNFFWLPLFLPKKSCTPACYRPKKSAAHTLAFIKGLSRIVEPFSMGGSFSKMMNKLFANREMRILMLGLDAAGKTSNNPTPPQFVFLLSCCGCGADDRCSYIVQAEVESAVYPSRRIPRVRRRDRVTTIPTVGFNVETVTYKNVRFNVWVRISPYFGPTIEC